MRSAPAAGGPGALAGTARNPPPLPAVDPLQRKRELMMKMHLLMAVAGLAVLVAPGASQAQAVVRGAKAGAAVGNKAAGPVGAAVGGVVGGVSYGVRSGVDTVLGLPHDTGTVQRHRTSKKRPVHHR
jgi:hypothetical protein